ncbi:MAG: heme exporter protein CcmB [Rhodothermales bacterium]
MQRWWAGTWAIFEKELRLELRTRYALTMLLLFVLGALMLVLFSTGTETLTPRLQAALLWVVVLFSAAIGLGRTFLAEEDQGTVLLLQLNTMPSMVYAGKLLFNIVLMLTVTVLAVGVLLFVLGIGVDTPGLLALVLLLGAIGLAGATTLLSALTARSNSGGAMLPVLLLPLLLPLLIAVANATRMTFAGGLGWDGAGTDLATLVGFSGSVITASALLFDYVWID